MAIPHANQLRQYRREHQWSQEELAQRAGVSRAAVSAIEQQRLAPSVVAALALARALGCTVEELFGEAASVANKNVAWAWEPNHRPCRYWQADVAGQTWLYPAEPTNIGEVPYDGISHGKSMRALRDSKADDVLVLATCDPAIGLLADEYARQTPFRLLPLTRSSRHALGLLCDGKVHGAGLHLSGSSRSDGHQAIARETCGPGSQLLRVTIWEEGIASDASVKLTSTQQARRSRLTWVGREVGSGARDCLDELLADRTPPRRLAPDHRSVALAIRCGWADAGVCLRLAGEEAGLNFFELRREAYDLCFTERMSQDPRVRALVDVVRSDAYRRLIDVLPGYDSRTTGEIIAC